MPLIMWAKTAVGTNLTFAKGFGKALRNARELIQQAILKKAPKTQVHQKSDIWQRPRGHDYYFVQPVVNRLQSPILRSVFMRNANKNLANVLRRQAALRLGTFPGSSKINFRRAPLMSLIGMTLGFDATGLVNDSKKTMITEMREIFSSFQVASDPLKKLPQSLNDLDINTDSIANGCEGAVFEAKIKSSEPKVDEEDKFNLAVKAVFNYGAESNSSSILQELEREIVPVRLLEKENSVMWKQVPRLPAHPNIVDMPGMFIDDMLVTEEALKKYPAALPRSVNPDQCYGRNKTLYVVMKRRNTHLRDFLTHGEVTMETRCLLLTQLLEGVSHLTHHGIAHRDLKTDNLLVDIPHNGGTPHLEICDFGCCLAEGNKSLQVPFPSRDLYIGGNSWLMAPEISTAKPGPGNFLDFRKSDLWAVGAIAYEILGGQNPFYPALGNQQKQLSSRTFSEEDLPPLPEEVPCAVQRLVKALLSRDPSKRPSAGVAIAVMHLANHFNRGEVSEDTDGKKSQISSGRQTGWTKQPGRKGKKSMMVYIGKENRMFEWILTQSLALLCQLHFGSLYPSTWDMKQVMQFLFLSNLTYLDFREAVKFF